MIDEAGARVRLKAMTKPPNLKELDAKIESLNQEKEAAVAEQDFEKAAHFRDQADKIKKQKERITREWSDKSKEVGGLVDEEVIREVVGKMTGVPLTRINSDETARLLTMEDDLHKTVVSQHEAIQAIAKAVRKSRAGLKDPKRPIGSFIFAGPTGVGKTLLAKQLAKFMFGDENALVQIDMSEYSEKHNVSRLIGAPSGLHRLRRRRPVHGKDPSPAVQRGAARRNREGPSRSLEHAAPDHGRRPAHRQRRPHGRFQEQHPDHDDEHRRRADRRPARAWPAHA